MKYICSIHFCVVAATNQGEVLLKYGVGIDQPENYGPFNTPDEASRYGSMALARANANAVGDHVAHGGFAVLPMFDPAEGPNNMKLRAVPDFLRNS